MTQQLDLIEYANLGKRQWWLRHLPQLDMFQLLVLRAIDDKARGPNWVSMTRREIAAYWNGDQKKSLATVSRAVKGLEDAGLLFSEPEVDDRGQRANRYKIAWANVRDLANGISLDDPQPAEPADSTEPADDLEPEEMEGPPPSLSAKGATLTAKGSTLSDKGPFSHSEGALICERSPTSYSAKSNKSLLLLPESEPAITEGEAAELLKFVGMDRPMTAIRTALQAGATRADLQAIADHFRDQPGKWDGPGAVYHKLTEWFPGQPIEKGWPPHSRKWELEQHRQLKAAQAAQQQQQQQVVRQADSQAAAELEAQYGPHFDAMSDAAVSEFVRQHPHGKFQLGVWREKGRASPSFRKWMLSQLAKAVPEKGGVDDTG